MMTSTAPAAMTAPSTLGKRILIVDAYPLVRAGVRAALGSHSNFDICGEAANHHDTLRLIKELRPHLVTLGLNLKNYHWLELLKDIRVQFPSLLILVVSTQGESMYAQRAIKAGANGFMTSLEPLTEMQRAIASLFAGEIYVSRCVISQIASQLASRKHDTNGQSLHNLTDRELEIFEFLGEGLGVRQIAEHLKLGKSTVETYRTRIKEKLRLRDNSELLQSAIQWKCSGSLIRQAEVMRF
jgi:DNA-binding NarL/FixJ family response regulator